MRASFASIMLLLAAACRRDTPAVAATCQDPAWQPARVADSGVALCLPPRFRAVDPARRWARGEPGDSDFASLSVAVLDSAEAVSEWGAPPRPGTLRDPVDTTRLHAVRAESVTVGLMPVDGKNIEVETARISGGIGMHRQPYLRAVWRLPSGRWALTQGFATNPRDLELLRSMLGTVRLSVPTHRPARLSSRDHR